MQEIAAHKPLAMTIRGLLRRLRPGRAGGDEPAAGFGPEQAAYALNCAYVPEQIPGLMAGISGAAPALAADHLCFAAADWLIFVGYPLDGDFTVERSAAAVAQARSRYRPRILWFIGPQMPPELAATCRDRQSDVYYRLDLPAAIGPAARRAARAAAATLTVTAGRAFTAEHAGLCAELLARAALPPMVAALYRAMPAYLAQAPSAALLEARTAAGDLAAFYVVEQAAAAFDAYVLGAYSRRAYAPHASDLLFAAMIERAQAAGKPAINLGLGVNAGIRRFKEKWGAAPYLAYEFCECRFGVDSPVLDLLSEWKL
jgi:hypothetical protein